MKKIFAYIGSPLKQASNTAAITRMLIEALTSHLSDLQATVLTAGDVNVRHCTGCWNCMTKGKCSLDGKDDMSVLKKKMLEADFIIFGSPVYCMHVSGQMKTFLDRLAAWYHLMMLAGKPALTVSTTASSGVEIVHDYLGMLLRALGAKPVATLDAIGYFPNMLLDEGKAQRDAEVAAAKILPYLKGGLTVQSDDEMEQMFQSMKSKVTYGKEWLPADFDFWEQQGMLGLNSYQELLEHRHSNMPSEH